MDQKVPDPPRRYRPPYRVYPSPKISKKLSHPPQNIPLQNSKIRGGGSYPGYGTWQNFLLFWTIFCPFINPSTPQPRKSKFWKNEKKNPKNQKQKTKLIKNRLEISSFYIMLQKSWSYAMLFLRYGVRQI